MPRDGPCDASWLDWANAVAAEPSAQRNGCCGRRLRWRATMSGPERIALEESRRESEGAAEPADRLLSSERRGGHAGRLVTGRLRPRRRPPRRRPGGAAP